VKTLREEGRKDSAPDFPAKIVIAITVQHYGPMRSCIIALHSWIEIAKMGPHQTLPHALKTELEIESESLSSEGLPPSKERKGKPAPRKAARLGQMLCQIANRLEGESTPPPPSGPSHGDTSGFKV
jgi:hypothetical protein